MYLDMKKEVGQKIMTPAYLASYTSSFQAINLELLKIKV